MTHESAPETLVLPPRHEVRYLVNADLIPQIKGQLARAGFPLFKLPEQKSASISHVQTVYFATRDLEIPQTVFPRLRRYPVSSKSGDLSFDPMDRFILEIKTRSETGELQTKIKRGIQYWEIVDSNRQKNLLGPAVLAEVNGKPLIPRAVGTSDRSYYAAADLAGKYITIDQNTTFYGFFHNNASRAYLIGDLSNNAKLEIKGFTGDDPKLTFLKYLLESFGAVEQHPLFLEAEMKKAYLQALGSKPLL